MVSVGKPVAILIKNANDVSAFQNYQFTNGSSNQQTSSAPK
jgi:hypothetical protein